MYVCPQEYSSYYCATDARKKFLPFYSIHSYVLYVLAVRKRSSYLYVKCVLP